MKNTNYTHTHTYTHTRTHNDENCCCCCCCCCCSLLFVVVVVAVVVVVVCCWFTNLPSYQQIIVETVHSTVVLPTWLYMRQHTLHKQCDCCCCCLLNYKKMIINLPSCQQTIVETVHSIVVVPIWLYMRRHHSSNQRYTPQRMWLLLLFVHTNTVSTPIRLFPTPLCWCDDDLQSLRWVERWHDYRVCVYLAVVDWVCPCTCVCVCVCMYVCM